MKNMSKQMKRSCLSKRNHAFKPADRKLHEDAMVAAAPVGGGEITANATANSDDISSPANGISDEDVLGKCDHRHDGYLGPKCFHVPGRVGKLQKRIELPGKKKKKQKNPYLKGMKWLAEDDDPDIFIGIHALSEDDIIDFLSHSIGIDVENIYEIEAIVKLPCNKSGVYIKFKAALGNRSKLTSCFVEADFKNKKLVPTANRKPMSKTQCQKLFDSIATTAGISTAKDMKVWVMWGGL